jgi:hypothetical protein
MKSIRAILKQRDIYISLHCYELENWSTGLTVKYIVENQDIFGHFFAQYPLTRLDSIDDYFLYLLYLKIASLHIVIPHLVQEEDKPFFEQLSKQAKEKSAEITIGSVIRFINANYKEVFDKKQTDYTGHELREITLDYIQQYSMGSIDKSVLVYLCDYYGYLIIDRFDKFEKSVENNPELFELLYPSGHLKEVDGFRFSETLQIWAHLLEKKGSLLKQKIEARIDTLVQDAMEHEKSVSLGNAMQEEFIYEDIYEFLQRIKSPKAYGFEAVVQRVRALSANAFSETAHTIGREIPIEEIFQKWKGLEHWEYRLILLTHQNVEENGKKILKSSLDIKPPDKLDVFERARSNIKTDDYFTFTHQLSLSRKVLCCACMIERIMADIETLQDYCSMLISATAFIEKQMNVAYEHLTEDFQLLINMISLINGSNKSNEKVMQPLCYSAAMYSCALSEKLMRVFYSYLARNDTYIPASKATLGDMLKLENHYFKEVFGEDHLKSLAFFYIQTSPEKIGSNYRNALAHWTSISSKDMTPFFVEELLWLLTDVLNTIVLYFDKQQNSVEEEDDA